MNENNLVDKKLHPRNKHKEGYDFSTLLKKNEEMRPFVFVNDYGNQTIDFSNPEAVLNLNKSLLKKYYNITFWEIGKNNLCPPIPGRMDYIHYLADLLASDNDEEIPTGKNVKILDIGTGASAIYPILGAQEYAWDFVGTDIDSAALHFAQQNIVKNPWLKKQIEFRLQPDKTKMFDGVLEKSDHFTAVICNPPFYKSREDNWTSTTKKFNNLNKSKDTLPQQNFGGHPNELWYEGGERAFIRNMIYESIKYKDQLGWCTSLVADKANLKPLISVLEYNKAKKVTIIPMAQGNKISRILAWKF